MSYTPTEWESADIVTATRMNRLETAVGDANMSYTPNTWSDGDILTASKMNALEQAVAGGGGSSDFSIAQVAISGGEGEGVISMVHIEEGEFVYNNFQEFPVTCNCILYQGSQSNICIQNGDGDNYPGSALTVTGNIVINDAEYGYMTVTGDGSITIS